MKENVLANCYHETMDHLVDSIYQFIESIDKNPEAILSRIQRPDMSIFLKRDLYTIPSTFEKPIKNFQVNIF
ncbi:hypothetical protein ACT7DZ_20765 [Bacillus cereus]